MTELQTPPGHSLVADSERSGRYAAPSMSASGGNLYQSMRARGLLNNSLLPLASIAEHVPDGSDVASRRRQLNAP